MRTDTFKGRDFITLLDWSREEVEQILDLALELKRDRAIGRLHDNLLRAKTLFMIFYNQSLRTRNSFEAGMHQMGGHAHFLDPGKIYTPALPGREVAYSTERVSDVARVLARMGEGIAIMWPGRTAKVFDGYGRERYMRFIAEDAALLASLEDQGELELLQVAQAAVDQA